MQVFSRRPARFYALALAILWSLASPPAITAQTIPETLYESLAWREIGPYRGGRSAAVAGLASQPQVYYFGATGGGVWKTVDGGKTWANVSDGFFGGSIGAVAVAEQDPNVIYVGGGEVTVRGNVSPGDGLWKSTDAGKTWTAIGLGDSHHIPRIHVHPQDPDRVWVAALGHLFGPNEERGVFRSADGGKTWEKVLFVNDDTGAVDLALDPTNPRVLYASFWRVRRTPWSLESGGAGSGLWKSTDGGTTWTELSRHPGFPRGPLGIIGITVSASNPENLYAIIEAEDGGVFRSTDGGKTWTRVNEDRDLRQRAWYYSRIYADPVDEESVYVVNVRFHHSKDGGKTFTQIPTPHGDNHDLWIAPDDPLRMIEANDGGANVSFDGGKTWTPQNNQPTAQIYRLSTDNAFPYRLLGGQQDNTALRIRSRSALGSAIGPRDWEPTAGGESGHVVARPDDPDIVFGGSYGGFLTSFNHRTGEERAVNVWPDNPMGWGAAELKYRFQWNFPIFFSPHDPDLLYAAGNVLFKSRDGGMSWQTISPDLTRDDKAKQGPSGGPITKDNTSVEYYCTIFAAVESPHEPGVLWTGSDDGLIHLSRDGGETWSNITPEALPDWTQINSIEAHPFEKGGLYVAGTRYKLDDFRPYLYKTTDYGKTWTEIVQGIDEQHFTRVIRADPDRPGLLYAGTERGVQISFDDGAQWQSLQLELPIVPITDLAVKEGQLVVATQGRGFWILDDLSLLHQLEPSIAEVKAHFFAASAAFRLDGGSDEEPKLRGKNPPDGVLFHYFLNEPLFAEGEDKLDLQLTLLDTDGAVIRTFTRKPADGEETADEKEGEEKPDEAEKREDPRQLEAKAGMNRFVWNLRHPAAKRFPGLVLWSELDGPRAAPGAYRARLSLGDWNAEIPFEVLADPRSNATPDDYREQLAFTLGVRDKLSEIHGEITRLRAVREQLEPLIERLAEQAATEDLSAAARELVEKITTIEEVLYQTRNRSPQDPLNFPIRLNDKLGQLLGLASLGQARPTHSMVAVRDELFAAADQQLAALRTVWNETLPALNQSLLERQVLLVALPDAGSPEAPAED